MGIFKRFLQDIFKPEVKIYVKEPVRAPESGTSGNISTANGFECSHSGCSNNASMKVKYESNDGSVKFEEYKCKDHREMSRKELRKHKKEILGKR